MITSQAVSTNFRTRAAYGVAGAAVLLRMASDWIFPAGGPFYYQAIQAGLLLLAIVMLRGELERIYLTGGDYLRSIRSGLFAIPLGVLSGAGLSWFLYGSVSLPSPELALIVIGSNIFFPVVEELEFRGFLLSWMVSRKIRPRLAVFLVMAVHVLSHPHWFFEGSYASIAAAVFLFLWYGSLTLQTRSLWGACLAHSLYNILAFLPLAGAGMLR